MTHDDVALTVITGLVPLHLADLTANPSRLEKARQNVDAILDAITSDSQGLLEGNCRLTDRGGVVRYTKARHRERGQALHAVARGLAICALTVDGGVAFHGLHWCTTPGCRATSAHPPTDDDLL